MITILTVVARELALAPEHHHEDIATQGLHLMRKGRLVISLLLNLLQEHQVLRDISTEAEGRRVGGLAQRAGDMLWTDLSLDLRQVQLADHLRRAICMNHILTRSLNAHTPHLMCILEVPLGILEKADVIPLAIVKGLPLKGTPDRHPGPLFHLKGVTRPATQIHDLDHLLRINPKMVSKTEGRHPSTRQQWTIKSHVVYCWLFRPANVLMGLLPVTAAEAISTF